MIKNVSEYFGQLEYKKKIPFEGKKIGKGNLRKM